MNNNRVIKIDFQNNNKHNNLTGGEDHMNTETIINNFQNKINKTFSGGNEPNTETIINNFKNKINTIISNYNSNIHGGNLN
jgi:hypothetical protein